MQDHLSDDDTDEPHRNFHNDEYSDDDVVVTFVEGFAPVGQQINNNLGFVWVVSILENSQ